MRQSDILSESLHPVVSSVEDLVDATGVTKFTTLRKVVGYGVILPWFVFVLVIIAVLLGFTVLAAKLSSAFIDRLENLSTACWFGKRKT